MVTEKIQLDRIRTDGGTQPRTEISNEVVADYAEQMKWGAEFPPAIVFHDGADYWLADGFHRYWAAMAIEARDLLCEVRQGAVRNAILHSVGANAKHGSRRTNADKRKAVLTLLNDPEGEWSTWTDRRIADVTGISAPTVKAIRSEWASVNSLQIPASRTCERNGTTYTINTANIGRNREDRSDASEERVEVFNRKTGEVMEVDDLAVTSTRPLRMPERPARKRLKIEQEIVDLVEAAYTMLRRPSTQISIVELRKTVDQLRDKVSCRFPE